MIKIFSRLPFLCNVAVLLFAFVLFSGFSKGGKGSTKTKTVSQVISTTVTDVDGNTYSIIKIGNQQWMLENLKTKHYSNGKPITEVKDSTRWSVVTSGAYCNYANDTLNCIKEGLLYNWFAVNDSQKLCPTDWHVPSDVDWNTLEETLGGESVAGGKMKDTVSLWSSSFGGTNESGFKGIPSGCRTNKGTFNSIGFYGLWWSSTENYTNYAWYRCVNYNSTDLFRHYYYKRYGFSIRCLKD
jgi:uncharacterized protein (TIGR02145 family)